jgi:hypothetical protein
VLVSRGSSLAPPHHPSDEVYAPRIICSLILTSIVHCTNCIHTSCIRRCRMSAVRRVYQNDDLVRHILDHLDTAHLLVVLTLDKSFFRLVIGILWRHVQIEDLADLDYYGSVSFLPSCLLLRDMRTRCGGAEARDRSRAAPSTEGPSDTLTQIPVVLTTIHGVTWRQRASLHRSEGSTPDCLDTVRIFWSPSTRLGGEQIAILEAGGSFITPMINTSMPAGPTTPRYLQYSLTDQDGRIIARFAQLA